MNILIFILMLLIWDDAKDLAGWVRDNPQKVGYWVADVQEAMNDKAHSGMEMGQ